MLLRRPSRHASAVLFLLGLASVRMAVLLPGLCWLSSSVVCSWRFIGLCRQRVPALRRLVPGSVILEPFLPRLHSAGSFFRTWPLSC
uniref:Uncharacterized protein n=1 Tax=Setaria italica TaxID=4555 RepID=K3YNW5_SETIT